jgi:hypothetical protein
MRFPDSVLQMTGSDLGAVAARLEHLIAAGSVPVVGLSPGMTFVVIWAVDWLTALRQAAARSSDWAHAAASLRASEAVVPAFWTDVADLRRSLAHALEEVMGDDGAGSVRL